MGCIPTGHITVATASCPRARIPPEGNRAPGGPSLSGWHSLPRCPGTFARWSHQTLMQCSPPLRGALPWFPPRWPFVLRSYLPWCTFIHCLGAAMPKSAPQLSCRFGHQLSCWGPPIHVGTRDLRTHESVLKKPNVHVCWAYCCSMALQSGVSWSQIVVHDSCVQHMLFGVIQMELSASLTRRRRLLWNA